MDEGYGYSWEGYIGFLLIFFLEFTAYKYLSVTLSSKLAVYTILIIIFIIIYMTYMERYRYG